MSHTAIPPRNVLALHGSASSGAIWRPLIKALEGQRVVLAPDLPGYGKNAARSEYDADARFAWLGETICKLGGQFDLVGHSFGGAVALKLANQFPNHVHSITLYEPIVPPSGRLNDMPEIETLWSLWTRMMRRDTDAAMTAFCDFWSGENSWAAMAAKARQRLIADFPSVMLDFRQVFTGQMDVEAIRFKGALTILHGDASPPVAAAMSRRLAETYPQARLALLPDLGHLAPVTHPDRIVAAVRAALEPDCAHPRQFDVETNVAGLR